MFLLVFIQNKDETPLALFESMEAGRKFVQTIPGYKKTETVKKNYHIIYEHFSPENLPDYIELEYNGNRVPLTKFMFRDKDDVDILWREIPNLEVPNQGLTNSQTLVDAYSINNNELKSYITKRELSYDRVKTFLEKRGYDVDRHYHGSEDGEAIVYKKKNEDDWHFLIHMDPLFVDETPHEEDALEKWIEESLQ